MSAGELEAAKKERKAARKEGGEFKKRMEVPWGNKQDRKRNGGSNLNKEDRKKAQARGKKIDIFII